MNNCERYIIGKGGKIRMEKGGYFYDGYFIKNKIFIEWSMFRDRKRISKKFKKIIDLLIKDGDKIYENKRF
jgi:hypothetical protein